MQWLRELKILEDREPRYKVVWFSPRTLLVCLTQVVDREWLEVRQLDLPDGAEVVNVGIEWCPPRVGVLVYHPSFNPIKDGEMPPAECGNVTVVRLKSVLDEDGYRCFVVPGNGE